MIAYNQFTIIQRIISIPNSSVKSLNSDPYLLLPAFSGYYTILNVALDYDNVNVNISGGYDWSIVNLNANILAGGNDNIMSFIWSSDNYQRPGIMQGINGNTSYVRNFRNESIYLSSQQDDGIASFNYANINIVYTQNPI